MEIQRSVFKLLFEYDCQLSRNKPIPDTYLRLIEFMAIVASTYILLVQFIIIIIVIVAIVIIIFIVIE